MRAARIIIAGLKGGSGKTTVSVGLIRALARRGLRVTPFKKGPDFIDPGWLSRAALGAACYTLDPFLIGQDRVRSNFIRHFGGSDCAVIEGNRGLFDGMDAEGSLSTAQLARTLKSPVILIIDCTKMTRTAAAVVTGVVKFDPRLRLAGVVLNRIAGARHEDIIRRSIKKYCSVPVLGAIPRLPSLGLPERHMGLTPHEEHPAVEESISRIAGAMAEYLDLGGILEAARGAPPLKAETRESEKKTPPFVRIGIMRDSAFQFYYPENFEELEERGAELVEISALREKSLPDIDALYIGGGFPETHAIALAGNGEFKKSLKKAVGGGLPVYAECGGLMYLGKSLLLEGREYPMAGVLPVSFALHGRPQAHGYTILKVARKNPFYRKNSVLYGHEFHYSGSKSGPQPPPSDSSGGKPTLAFKMLRGVGLSEGMDGFLFKNVLATYTHVHALGTPEWADGMIRAAKAYRGR